MALTRPKIWDIDTAQIAFNDPLTVLHQGATSANIDVGFLFNRANGLVSNVAVYWSEANQSFIHAFTSNSGVSTDVNVAVTSLASVTAGSVYTNGLFYASNSQPYTGAVTTYQQVTGNSNPSIYTAFTLANTAPTLVDSLPYTGNVMVSWTITSKDNVNNRFARTTIDSINDGAGNVYYTQYGTIKSNNSFNVATFTSNVTGSNINLYAVGDSSSVNISFERHVLGSATPTGYINNYGPPGTVAATSGIINTSNTTTATSTTSGALIVSGGAGIAGNLWAGNVVSSGFFYANGTNALASTSITSDLVNVYGRSYGGDSGVYYLLFGNVNSTNATTQIGASNGMLWNASLNGGQLAVPSLSATNINTGSATVGLFNATTGIQINFGNLSNKIFIGNVGTTTQFSSCVFVTAGNVSTSTTSGAMIVSGGAGIAGNVYIGGNVYVTSNAATGTTTRVEYNVPHPFMLMGAA